MDFHRFTARHTTPLRRGEKAKSGGMEPPPGGARFFFGPRLLAPNPNLNLNLNPNEEIKIRRGCPKN
jgi:hypothetical protein